MALRNLNLGLRRLRYQELAETLAESIKRGKYKVGALLPAEDVLCRDFRLSRFTVREALRQLQASGLIERRHGTGTIVLASEPPKTYSHTIASIEDILQYAEATHFIKQQVRMVTADATLTAEIGCERGARLLRMEAVRVQAKDGKRAEPIAWSRVLLIEKYAGLRARLAVVQHGIADLVEHTYGELTVAVEQDIRAIAIQQKAAKALGVPAGSPGLRVDRKYIGRDGKPYLYATAMHVADRFSLSMRLNRTVHGR